MQPTYLPWSGYFNLISQATHFVLLDDVQFEKSSWQNRNRILLNGEPQYITVPTKRQFLEQPLKDIEADERQNWRRKHVAMLRQVYSRHPYGSEVVDLIAGLITDEATKLLVDLNMQILQTFCRRLDLAAPFHRASALGIGGARSERLEAISKHFDCEEYLSPVGSREYLEQDGIFERSPIRLVYQEYTPSQYPQHRHGGWASHLSIVDVVANIGWDAARAYVRTGKYLAESKEG